MIKINEKIKAIELRDVSEDMYADSLSETVDSRYIDLFREAAEGIAPAESYSATKALYKLCFLEEKGSVAEELTVTAVDSFKAADGTAYSKDDTKLGELIKRFEEEYSITVGLWERAPGSGYLALLGEVSEGELYRIRKTQFEEILETELTAGMLSQLAETAGSVSFEPLPAAGFEKRYNISLYDKDGAGVYTFFADSEGRVFTEFGYEVHQTPFGEWIEQLKKEHSETEDK